MARYFKYKDEAGNDLYSIDLNNLNFQPYIPGVGVNIKHDTFSGKVHRVEYDATTHVDPLENYNEVEIYIKLDVAGKQKVSELQKDKE